jgi:hypothetical protein
VPAVRDLAPHDPADPGPLPRVTANAVVHLGLVASVVMIPLVMPEGPGGMMRLAAPGPPAAIAPGGQVHPARLLVIVERLVPRVMRIGIVLPATMIHPLMRMRPPVSSIDPHGVN